MVGEVSQRQVDLGCDLAQPGHASRIQVALVEERAAVQEPDQPRYRWAVRSGDRGALGDSVITAQHLGDPQLRTCSCYSVGSIVLDRDLGGPEGRIRHLEHRHRFAVGCPDEEVGVLVATQLVGNGVDTERFPNDPSSPRLVDTWRGKGDGVEEVHPGRHLTASVRSWVTAPSATVRMIGASTSSSGGASSGSTAKAVRSARFPTSMVPASPCSPTDQAAWVV